MYGTDKLIASIFCVPIPRIRVFQKGSCNLEFQTYTWVTTNTSFGLQSYYIHNYCHIMASKVRGLRVESNNLPQLILSCLLVAFVYQILYHYQAKKINKRQAK